MARERLDKLLVDRQLAASRERARALVMAGAVLVDDRRETKPGTLVDTAATIVLRTEDHPYVSRGALKIVHGLDAFGIDPSGRIAIDVGASTGGFTDVLLRRGAARVYCIDVGYGQLAWSIRNDPRVVVLERRRRAAVHRGRRHRSVLRVEPDERGRPRPVSLDARRDVVRRTDADHRADDGV